MVLTRVVSWEICGRYIGDCLSVHTNDLQYMSVYRDRQQTESLQTFLRRASSGDTGFGAIICLCY